VTDTSTRRLATVETITEIAPIPGADAIVRARIRGWDVVVKKGEFAPGAKCVYFEVDTMLDVDDPRFDFLAARGVRTDAEGRKGHVLKTARLRGQYSQGLALPLSAFPEASQALEPGTDVTAYLPVWKWEAPVPASIAGQVRGMRPSWIPATDEERIQNIPGILQANATWVATEKIDGTSCTFWIDYSQGTPADYGVCSRNLDLLPADGNTLWRMARTLDIHNRIADEICEPYEANRVALQGEVFGEGIQANPLRLKGHHFRAFTLRIDGREIPRGDWPEWVRDLSVPVLGLEFPASLDEALAQADGIKSTLADRPAEGIVWRASDGAHVMLPDGSQARGSFKVISRAYLLKNDR